MSEKHLNAASAALERANHVFERLFFSAIDDGLRDRLEKARQRLLAAHRKYCNLWCGEIDKRIGRIESGIKLLDAMSAA